MIGIYIRNTIYSEERVFLTLNTCNLSMKTNTLYWTLQFQDDHLIMQTIKLYYHNNEIKIAVSKNERSQTNHLLD